MFTELTSFSPEDGGSIYLEKSAALPTPTLCKHRRLILKYKDAVYSPNYMHFISQRSI
jgi:hypothetical protein